MTNDMIAVASDWEERLRAPKADKKDDPQVWTVSFPHPITLTQREINLNLKAMIIYKRPTTTGQLLQAPCFKQDERVCQRVVGSLWPLCTLW